MKIVVGGDRMLSAWSFGMSRKAMTKLIVPSARTN